MKHPNTTTIRLPERHRALLAALKAQLNIPASQVILRAIEEYARKLHINV